MFRPEKRVVNSRVVSKTQTHVVKRQFVSTMPPIMMYTFGILHWSITVIGLSGAILSGLGIPVSKFATTPIVKNLIIIVLFTWLVFGFLIIGHENTKYIREPRRDIYPPDKFGV